MLKNESEIKSVKYSQKLVFDVKKREKTQKNLFDIIKQTKSPINYENFSILFHFNTLDQEQRDFFVINTIQQGTSQFKQGNQIIFALTSQKLIIRLNNEILILQELKYLKETIIHVGVLQYQEKYLFYINGQQKIVYSSKGENFLQSIKIIESNVLSLQLFQYAIPLLTIKYCQYNPYFQSDTLKSPLYCYQTANLITQRWTNSDGIRLPDFEKQKDCLIFSVNKNQDSAKQLLSEQIFNLDKFLIKNYEYNSIQNNYLSLTSTIVDQLFTYGFSSIKIDKCVAFIINGSFDKIFGSLDVEYLQLQLPNQINSNLYQIKYSYSSPFITQSILNCSNVEDIFLENWHNYKFDNLNLEYAPLLAKVNSPYLYVAISIDIQSNFLANTDLFYGLLISQNCQQISNVLQVVKFRYLNNHTQIQKNNLNLVDFQKIAVKFKGTKQVYDNTSQILLDTVNFISQLIDPYFFEILNLIFDLVYKHFPNIFAILQENSFQQSLKANILFLLQKEDFDSLFDLITDYNNKFEIFQNQFVLAFHSLQKISTNFIEYYNLVIKIGQKSTINNEQFELNLFNLCISNAITFKQNNDQSYIYWIILLVKYKCQLDVPTQQSLKQFNLRKFNTVFDDFMLILQAKQTNFPTPIYIQDIIIYLDLNCYNLIGQIIIEQVKLLTLTQEQYLQLINIKCLSKQQMLIVKFFMIKLLVQQDENLCSQQYIHSSQEEIILQDQILTYSKLYKQQQQQQQQSIQQSPYFDDIFIFLQIIERHPDYIKIFFLQYYIKEIVQFLISVDVQLDDLQTQIQILFKDQTLFYIKFGRINTISLEKYKVETQNDDFPFDSKLKYEQQINCNNLLKLDDYFDQQNNLILYWQKCIEQLIIQNQILQKIQFNTSSYGRYQLRQITFQRQVYHQQFYQNNFKFQVETPNKVTLQHFIPPNIKIILAFNILKNVSSSLSLQPGILIICEQLIIFVPDAKFSNLSQCYFTNQNLDQFINLKTKNILINKVFIENQSFSFASQYIAFGQNFEVLTDNFEQSFTKTLYILPNQIINILQEQYCHRNIQINIILNNGYSYQFVFNDILVQNSSDIYSCQISSEIQLGIFNYYYSRLFQGNCDGYICNPLIVQEIFKKQIPLNYLLGLNQRILIHPKYIQNEEFKQKLMKNFESSPYNYNGIQQKNILNNISNIKKQDYLNIPQFESFQNKNSLVYFVNLLNFSLIQKTLQKTNHLMNAKNQHIILAQLYLEFYQKGLLDNFHFISLVNQLSQRNNQSFIQSPLFPIIKNRIICLPTQCQTIDKLLSSKQKLESITQINQLSIQNTMLFFDQNIPLHGTFPSNSASNLYYKFRQQPYTSALIELQNGSFDSPDRMFHSYNDLYRTIFETNSKEHIPDLYTNIELFYNNYNLELGTRSDKSVVNNLVFSQIDQNQTFNFNQKFSQQFDVQLKLQNNSHPYIDLNNIENGQEQNNITPINNYQLFPIQTENNLINLLTLKDQQSDETVPSNPLQCQFELFQYLQNSQKDEILQWISLFFGVHQYSSTHYTLYSPTTYYLRVQNQSLNDQFDQIKYFGIMPNRLFNYRFQLSSSVFYSLQQSKYKLISKLQTVDLQKYLSHYIQNNDCEIEFSQTNYFPSEYLCHKNFLTKCQCNMVQSYKKDFIHFKTQFYDSIVLKQTANDNNFCVLLKNQIFLYSIKKSRLQLLQLIEIQAIDILLSDSQILYILTNEKIFCYDAINYCVLAQNNILNGQCIKIDKYEYLYIQVNQKINILTPELIILGDIELNNFTDFVPFERMKILFFDKRNLQIVQIIPDQYESYETVEFNQGFQFIPFNCFEAVNSENLVDKQQQRKIIKCSSVAIQIQSKFSFASQIKDIQIKQYSIFVICVNENYSIVAE